MIKRILVVIAFFASTIYANSQATLKTNILPFTFGFLNATYEVPVSRKFAFETSSAIFPIKPTKFGVLGVGIRRYFHQYKDSPNGLFLHSGVTSIYSDGEFGLILGVSYGYQWISEINFVLDIGFTYGFEVIGNVTPGKFLYPNIGLGYQF